MNMENDFGFSLVSEEELRKHEEELKKQVEHQIQMTSQVHKNAQELNNKLRGLRDMIMPLLNNLSKDPDKNYILWPGRAAKIQEFITKIDSYIES